MKLKGIFCGVSLAAALLAAPGYGIAQPITYTLENVSFDDDATASGTFTFDASTDVFTAWNISTEATPVGDAGLIGGVPMNSASYVSTGPSSASSSNAEGVFFDANGSSGFNNGAALSLIFSPELSASGATVQLTGFESQNGGFLTRSIVKGGEAVATVPAPASFLLLFSGLGLLARTGRRSSFAVPG